MHSLLSISALSIDHDQPLKSLKTSALEIAFPIPTVVRTALSSKLISAVTLLSISAFVIAYNKSFSVGKEYITGLFKYLSGDFIRKRSDFILI